MEHLNVNVLLCGKCDDDLNNVYNIFNALKINEDGRASFTIVTLINGFEVEYRSLGLYYFLQKNSDEEKKPFMYLGGTVIESTEENKRVSTGEEQECSKDKSIQEMFKTYLNGVAFLGKGQYEVQVYLYKDDEVHKKDFRLSRTEKIALKNEDKLVAICNFEVI